MELKDLLGQDIKDLSDEEITKRIRLLQTLRIAKTNTGKKKKTHKSNKEIQITDMLSGLSTDKLQELQKMLNGGK